MECLSAVALEPLDPVVGQLPSKTLLRALDDLAE
jgi:hypothetical protein